MTVDDVHEMPLGLYRIFWKSGGSSLAAVGMSSDGSRWLAPCNWIAPAAGDPSHWRMIARVELLFSTQELRAWEEAGQ